MIMNDVMMIKCRGNTGVGKGIEGGSRGRDSSGDRNRGEGGRRG